MFTALRGAPKKQTEIDGTYIPTRSGFATEEAAKEYIKSRYLCDSCKKALEAGFIEIPYKTKDGVDKIHRMDTSDVMYTACGSEWIIITDEEYKKDKSFINHLFGEIK